MDANEIIKTVQGVEKSIQGVKHLAVKAAIADYIRQSPKSVQDGHDFHSIASRMGYDIDVNEFNAIMQELIAESKQLYNAFKDANRYEVK